jgi:hypothetical protein
MWPKQYSYTVVTENTGTKKSSCVPPDWVQVKRHYYEIYDEQIIYYATFYDVPTAAIKKYEAKALDIITNWMYHDDNPLGKVDRITVKPILMSKWPARECIGVRKGYPIAEKLFLVGNHVCVLGIYAKTELFKNPNVQEFMMSFEVKE